MADDEDYDMVCEVATLFLLLVASSSILMRIWWSGDDDGSDITVALIREGVTAKICS